MTCKCHDNHQKVCIFKVVPPIGPDFTLSTDVPDIKFETLRLHTFDVETLQEWQHMQNKTWE